MYIKTDKATYKATMKNGFLRLLYEPVPEKGLPAFNDQKEGDIFALSWFEGRGVCEHRAGYQVTSVNKKDNLAVLYCDLLREEEVIHEVLVK